MSGTDSRMLDGTAGDGTGMTADVTTGAVRVRYAGGGVVEAEADRWRMTVAADGQTARLYARDGATAHHPVELQLPGALDRTDRSDETLSVEAPELEPAGRWPVVTVRRRSSAWLRACTRVE